MDPYFEGLFFGLNSGMQTMVLALREFAEKLVSIKKRTVRIKSKSLPFSE